MTSSAMPLLNKAAAGLVVLVAAAGAGGFSGFGDIGDIFEEFFGGGPRTRK